MKETSIEQIIKAQYRDSIKPQAVSPFSMFYNLFRISIHHSPHPIPPPPLGPEPQPLSEVDLDVSLTLNSSPPLHISPSVYPQ